MTPTQADPLGRSVDPAAASVERLSGEAVHENQHAVALRSVECSPFQLTDPDTATNRTIAGVV